RAGRSKFASTGTKLGADYTYEGVLASIQQLREAEKEIDDEQGYGEGDELSAAIARLAADGPRRGGAGPRERGREAGRATGAPGGGDREAGVGGVHAQFDAGQHAALRAALARERSERDEQDARRDREDRERQARREDQRRRDRERHAAHNSLPGVEAGEADGGDVLELGGARGSCPRARQDHLRHEGAAETRGRAARPAPPARRGSACGASGEGPGWSDRCCGCGGS